MGALSFGRDRLTETAQNLVFVSYATQDVAGGILDVVSRAVTTLGTAFIDPPTSRSSNSHEIVKRSLEQATKFCAVITAHYLLTTWTRWEFDRASARGIPLYRIDPTDLTVARMAGQPLESSIPASEAN
jgi:hypothetical protein